MRRLIMCCAAVMTLGGSAFASTPSSGLMLGAQVREIGWGLQVQGTLPGYPVDGKLFPGDVMMELRSQGADFPIRKVPHIEWAKAKIGMGRPAFLKIARPSQGVQWYEVQFVPVSQLGWQGGGNTFIVSSVVSEAEVESRTGTSP